MSFVKVVYFFGEKINTALKDLKKYENSQKPAQKQSDNHACLIVI